MWSGRQPHNILHKHNNITVRGAWNNYEGVGACTPDPEGSPNSGRNDGCAPSIGGATTVTEQQLIAPMLEAGGYHTMVTGKTDWAAGGHSLTTMVDSWSIYVSAAAPLSSSEAQKRRLHRRASRTPSRRTAAGTSGATAAGISRWTRAARRRRGRTAGTAATGMSSTAGESAAPCTRSSSFGCVFTTLTPFCAAARRGSALRRRSRLPRGSSSRA